MDTIGDEKFEFGIFLLKNHEVSLKYKIVDTSITAWEGSFIVDNLLKPSSDIG